MRAPVCEFLPRRARAARDTMLLAAALLFTAVAASGGTPAASQAAGPCAAPQAHEFDFWVGDWDIDQKILRKDGTWLSEKARTSVSPSLDGCALVEHWEGTVQFFWEGMTAPDSMKGLSVRAWDPESGQWFIWWMDTRSPRFGVPYRGRFDGGRGEFFRRWETPHGPRRGRITFSDIQPGSVHWELAISSDEGKSWSTIWIMEMHRAGK
jgi:hypothetical protein